MAFWTYMLRCSDGHFYVGATDNLDQRVAQHQSGTIASCYTFKRRPVELVWSETFPDRLQAKGAEGQIKGWTRAKKEALILGDWQTISALARSRQDLNA